MNFFWWLGTIFPRLEFSAGLINFLMYSGTLAAVLDHQLVPFYFGSRYTAGYVVYTAGLYNTVFSQYEWCWPKLYSACPV
jgi:hypothetical protein